MTEQEIFVGAVELTDPAARAAYLDRACEGDPALRQRVAVLMGALGRAGDFLQEPAAPDPEATRGFEAAGGPAEAVGTTIGPFKLLEPLGEGGMGAVFVAEQRHPVRRKVALKLIKPGMDSKAVLARFDAERQALAMMDHPNIAKVLDAGATADGRPYFAMELVRGLPVTDYCDRARLPVPDRLALFADICRAVQHAHMKGVIHRDIKPSNVLVTVVDGRPVPKVIDFGIAKATGGALTDRTLHTGHFQMVGTPLYMAPEQAELCGVDIDTRADVYSLGVLLYELLTGTTPFDPEALRKAGFDEMRRIIREDEPARPSRRVSTLAAKQRTTVADRRGLDARRLGWVVRGELDWLVMRAIDKDRGRRYQSPAELAADIDRYLAGSAVEAVPPSAWYRLRKLARRNRVAVATTALVAAALLLGGVASAWKYMDERAARRDADDHRQTAERNADEAGRQTAEAVRAQGEAVASKQEAERQRNAVARNLYFADIRLGLVDWTAGNLARLTRKLADHVPPPGGDDLRGWEWFYLLSLCHQDERTLLDSRSAVRSAAWSPDGRYVAAAGDDGSTRVWDAGSGRLVRTFHPSVVLMRRLSWSPDGRWLAWTSVDSDNAVYLWRVDTDEVKALRGHTNSVWTVAWHPGSGRLASAGMDLTVRIWDLDSGACERVLPDPGGYSGSVAWSPDGGRLASANSGSGVRVWDTTSWQVVKEGLNPKGTLTVAWHPDGKKLAVGTFAGACVLYRTDDWAEAARWVAHRGYVSGVAWSPDASRLATSGADNLVKVWKPDGSDSELTYRGHRGPVEAVAWAPDGRRLVSASSDDSVKIWPVPPALQPRRLPGRGGAAPVIAWSQERNTLRTLDAVAGTITDWNAVTGQRLGQTSVVKGLSGQFAPGGGRVVIATTGTVASPTVPSADQLGPDPPLAVKNGDAQSLLVCDARSGRPVQTVKTTFAGATIFSPDASHLAVVSGGKLEVADLTRNEVRFRWDSRGIVAGTWSPDGRHLAVAGSGDWDDGGTLGYAGWVHVFDIGQSKRVLKLRNGTSRVTATAVAFSPDGQRLVTADADGLVEVWTVPAGRKVLSANLHTNRVVALAWSPDGRRVASAGGDRTVRLWDPAAGEELLRFDTPDGTVMQLGWSPDGHRLAAAGDDGGVVVWDASPGHRYLVSETYAREQTRAQTKEAEELWGVGRRDESVAVRVRALERQKSRLGPEHDDTLLNMDRLGAAYRATGRKPEATALHEEVLAKRTAKHGPDHVDTRTSLNNLAVDYMDADRLKEAIKLFEQAVKGRDGKLSVDNPVSVGNLAVAYTDAGHHDRAEPLLAELADHSRREDAKSPATADMLAMLGTNRLKQGKYGQAEPVLRECLAIRAEKLPDDWRHFNTLSQLGGALAGQGKHAEAEPLLVRGYEGMKQRVDKIPPQARPRLPEAVERLVRLYEATGRPEKAQEWRAKLPPASTGGP